MWNHFVHLCLAVIGGANIIFVFTQKVQHIKGLEVLSDTSPELDPIDWPIQ